MELNFYALSVLYLVYSFLGWVAETVARPQTASPTLAELSFPAMELYAMPAATQTLLDDAIKSGELEPAYAIFATYRQRVDERVEYARSLLKQDIFDFTGDDRFHYDREDAEWVADADALDALWKQ